MTLNGYTRAVFALALSCAGLWGQTVASSLVGTVADTRGAAVAEAQVTLTSAATTAIRSATTDGAGTFQFVNLDAGTYSVTVRVAGFKTGMETDIVVLALETHSAGIVALQSGNPADVVSVKAPAVQLPLADSALAYTLGTQDLEDLTQKGRDLFGYMRLIPGIVDTRANNRNVTSSGSIAGIVIDGNTSAINFTVDGNTDLDTGTDDRVRFEPNVDSIQEIRVLEANYQAEYGRNSGGNITVITKRGTQDFHGTASWDHRNQEFNANSWANNHTLTAAGTAEPREAYRFNVETYGIGGPLFIPTVFNQEKKKVFFYFSQERTAQFVPAPTQTTYMPTADEIGGNFSQTFANVNGNPGFIPVLDPLNGNTPFSGNIIPVSRLTPAGTSLLGYFPSPNFTPTLSNQLYVDNYFEQGSDSQSRRNDVLRLDFNITPKITANFRWMNDRQQVTQLFDGVQFNQTAGSAALVANISPIVHPSPGHGYLGSVSDAITPTLVNEIRIGKSWNQDAWYTTDTYASETIALVPDLPILFNPVPPAGTGYTSPVNSLQALLPTTTFGGSGLPSSAYYQRNSASAGAAEDFNNAWTAADNVTKTLGRHIFKAGFYGERTTRIQPAGQNYNGAYNFAASTSDPFLDTNDGYANALLGDVNTFSQYTSQSVSNILYYNAEFYLQDSWKVNRRLTLDLGIRFNHETPPIDQNGSFVNFVPSDYNRSAVSRLYYPACSNGVATCSSAANGLVARDRLTGATVGSGYIGDIVIGSGDPVTGMNVLGTSAAYHAPGLAYAPRLGFAWDVFGDGKTAIRGGWGLFRNSLATEAVAGLSGQAPMIYQQTVSDVTFSQIAAANTGSFPSISNVTIAPVSPNSWPSSIPSQGVENASVNIQHIFSGNTVVGVGATLNHSFDQYLTYDLNYIPIGTAWPFTPSNLNPTTSGNTSADIGSIFERSIYPGYGPINGAAFLGSSTYHNLNARVTRQLFHGLSAAVAYTWSKDDGVTTYSPEVANNNAYNYGPLAFDRRQDLQISYVYNIPDFASKHGLTKLAIFTDHLQLSGVTSIESGAPYDPTCSVTDGQPAPASYTGTPDLSPRCNVVGNPLTGAGSNGNGTEYFNAGAFALPALGAGPNNSIVGPPVLGNLGGGAGVLTLPHTTNFDATLSKIIPLFGSESRVLKIQVQAYNVFNHTEISGVNSAIQFNPATNQVSNPSGVGFINAAFPNRILCFSARLVF